MIMEISIDTTDFCAIPYVLKFPQWITINIWWFHFGIYKLEQKKEERD